MVYMAAEVLFKCAICTKACTRKAKLKRHLTLHNETKSSNVIALTIVCFPTNLLNRVSLIFNFNSVVMFIIFSFQNLLLALMPKSNLFVTPPV